jgi:hypothetical protein
MNSHFTQALATERIAERNRKAVDRLAVQTARHSGRQDRTGPARPGRIAALALAARSHWLATLRLVSEHRQTRPLAD